MWRFLGIILKMGRNPSIRTGDYKALKDDFPPEKKVCVYTSNPFFNEPLQFIFSRHHARLLSPSSPSRSESMLSRFLRMWCWSFQRRLCYRCRKGFGVYPKFHGSECLFLWWNRNINWYASPLPFHFSRPNPIVYSLVHRPLFSCRISTADRDEANQLLRPVHKQSLITIRAGTGDSTIWLLCGADKEAFVFHCKAGYKETFRVPKCTDLKKVFGIRE